VPILADGAGDGLLYLHLHLAVGFLDHLVKVCPGEVGAGERGVTKVADDGRLQCAANLLFAFDRLEQRLEIPLAEAF
jgi:hypothetical protein